MGVVSGIVMSYQFGTMVGLRRQDRAVISPLMAYEVMTAFFLEAASASCCSASIASARGCISWRR
jgi:cytochrome bd-type quinol oxidase subunit 1